MSKRTRQQAILELVSKKRIPSQAAMAEELKKKNFDVTQATLSRDIAELNLVKSKEGYTRPQDAGAEEHARGIDPAPVLKRSVTKMTVTSNMLVIKTDTGNAQPVAVALDSAIFDEIVGTIAGDDTVLVVTGTTEMARVLEAKLAAVLE